MFLHLAIITCALITLTMPHEFTAHTTFFVPAPAALRADLLAVHNAQYRPECTLIPTLNINSDLIYEASFGSQSIRYNLFNPDLVTFHGRDIIRISGSNAEQRCPRDWFGDYFGLKRPIITNFSFDPWINNYIFATDIVYRFTQSPCWSIRAFVPLVYTRWNLGAFEHNIQTGTCNSSYPAGYFADLFTPVRQVVQAEEIIGVPCVSLLCTARQFFSDMLTPNLTTPNDSADFIPLQQSRFAKDTQSKVVLADIYATIGRTVVSGNTGRADLLLATIIPTSVYADTDFLFSPMAGNGGHWGLGAALDAQATIWRSLCDDQWVLANVYASLTHLFSTSSFRTLDLKNKPHSRYITALLLQQSDQTISQLGSFEGIFNPVANLSTIRVSTDVAIQANSAVVATFAFHKQRYMIGYDFYARSCENITLVDTCSQLTMTHWALKGDAFVYGFIPSNVPPTAGQINMPVALTVSQSEATIHRGTNNTGPQDNINLFSKNSGVDNAKPAFYDEAIPLTRQPNQMDNIDNQQLESNPPIVLSVNDLDLDSARTTAHQHAVLAQWAYLFERPTKTGSIRIGCKIVFAHKPPKWFDIPTCCENTACNTWSAWFGGGLSF